MSKEETQPVEMPTCPTCHRAMPKPKKLTLAQIAKKKEMLKKKKEMLEKIKADADKLKQQLGEMGGESKSAEEDEYEEEEDEDDEDEDG